MCTDWSGLGWLFSVAENQARGPVCWWVLCRDAPGWPHEPVCHLVTVRLLLSHTRSWLQSTDLGRGEYSWHLFIQASSLDLACVHHSKAEQAAGCMCSCHPQGMLSCKPDLCFPTELVLRVQRPAAALLECSAWEPAVIPAGLPKFPLSVSWALVDRNDQLLTLVPGLAGVSPASEQELRAVYVLSFAVSDVGASGCLVSLATTLASPCVSMHFLTAFRMSCNRRSKARRWGSVRTGARGSCRRDSLITALSWYSGSASSCRRSSVVLFILEEKESRRPSAKHHSTLVRDSCLSLCWEREEGGKIQFQRTVFGTKSSYWRKWGSLQKPLVLIFQATECSYSRFLSSERKEC